MVPMTMHPQFVMKMSEGHVSIRNERACREIKGKEQNFPLSHSYFIWFSPSCSEVTTQPCHEIDLCRILYV